jgi:hypothetical protein
MHHHKYSLEDLDRMLPWEREVYITMLIDQLEKEKEERKQRNGQRNS